MSLTNVHNCIKKNVLVEIFPLSLSVDGSYSNVKDYQSCKKNYNEGEMIVKRSPIAKKGLL